MTYQAKKTIAVIAAIAIVAAGVVANGLHRNAQRAAYAEQHNCEWSYETNGDFDAEPVCIAK